MEDKMLICSTCQGEFVWTAGEQEYYAQMDYVQPKRCKACRDKKKRERESVDGLVGSPS